MRVTIPFPLAGLNDIFSDAFSVDKKHPRIEIEIEEAE